MSLEKNISDPNRGNGHDNGLGLGNAKNTLQQARDFERVDAGRRETCTPSNRPVSAK